MRKIVFEGPKRAVIQEAERPVCGTGQVLLKMKRVGVCGTDIQVFAGKNRYMEFPVVPFHEGIAVVEETGEGVNDIAPGCLVTIRPILSCNTCYSCKKSRKNACMNFNSLGVQSDGLGADYFAVSREYVYPLEQDADLDKVIFIEPFAVGVHAAYQGGVKGKAVLVVGGGTIGNFTAQACRLAGAEKTAVCDISQDKIRMAEKSGIDFAVNTSELTLVQAAQKCFGGFPDVIIDCAAVPAVFSQILEMAGKTTDIVIVGNYSVLVETDIAKIQRNELTVKGCITYREEDFIRAKELIEEGSVYLEGFISKRYYFSQVQEMMEQALENKGINMKTIMDFEEE